MFKIPPYFKLSSLIQLKKNPLPFTSYCVTILQKEISKENLGY